MTVYQYMSKEPKKREKLLVAALFVAVGVLVAIANLPSLTYPMLFQLIAVILLVAAVMVVGKCLLCDYVYSLEPRTDADGDLAPDLVVTEYQGKRRSVVCRVSLDDIEDAVWLTAQNRKEFQAKQKRYRTYRYTARLYAQNSCLLTVRDGETVFYVRILADQTLFTAFGNKI